MDKKIKFFLQIVTICGYTLAHTVCISAFNSPSQGKINKDGINVRVDSTTSSPILGTLRRDDTVTLTGKKYSWYKIILPQNFSGFVASEYLEITKGKKGTVKANSLNIRHAPSLEAFVIGRIPKGETVHIKTTDNEWTDINCYPYAYGWVHKKFIEDITPGEIKTVHPPQQKIILPKQIDIPERKEEAKVPKEIKEKVKSHLEEKVEKPSSLPLTKGILKKIKRKERRCPANYMLENDTGLIFLKINSHNIEPSRFLGKHVSVWGRVKSSSCIYIEVTHILPYP